jgi:hypothetical protein
MEQKQQMGRWNLSLFLFPLPVLLAKRSKANPLVYRRTTSCKRQVLFLNVPLALRTMKGLRMFVAGMEDRTERGKTGKPIRS